MERVYRSPAWNRALFFAAVVTTAFYALGVSFIHPARVLFGLAVLTCGVGWLVSRRTDEGQGASEVGRASAYEPLLLGVLTGLLWALFAVRVGLRSVDRRASYDLALFVEAIHNIGRHGIPTVQLLEGRNFLTHHFVPFLYVPGALVKLGVPAVIAGTLVHALGLAVIVGSMRSAMRALGLSKGRAWWVVVAVLVTPAVRFPYAWTFNDETLGAPYVVLGLSLWLSGRYRLAATALSDACLCKESFSLTVLAAVVVALVFHEDFRPVEERSRARTALLPVAGVALALFVGYFFLQPLLFGKGFDHAGKLATAAQLFERNALLGKGLYVGSIFGPALFLPFFSRRGRILLLVALPSLLLTVVSNFPEMWKPGNYYAVTPTLVVFMALGAALVDLEKRRGSQFAASVAVLVWVGGLCFDGQTLGRPVWRALRQRPWPSSRALSFIPESAHVATDPASALYLLDHPKLTRLWGAASHPESRSIDFVVRIPGSFEEVPPELQKGTAPCPGPAESTAPFEIRCSGGRP